MTLISDIKRHEGFSATPYRCTSGKLTIGYGINIEAGITKSEASALLELRVLSIRNQIRGRLSCWDDLSDSRKDVLVNMGYNLGINGLFKFRKMLAAVGAKNWSLAAAEILQSKAARDLPRRYQELSEQMRRG